MPIYKLSYRRRKISDESIPKITCPENIIPLLKKHCFPEKDLWREQVWVALLGENNTCLNFFRVSMGGFKNSVIDKKLIIKTALNCNATSIILSHNHPSESPKPSQADIQETKSLKQALGVFDISLLDHIILTEDSYYSFATEKTTRL